MQWRKLFPSHILWWSNEVDFFNQLSTVCFICFGSIKNAFLFPLIFSASLTDVVCLAKMIIANHRGRWLLKLTGRSRGHYAIHLYSFFMLCKNIWFFLYQILNSYYILLFKRLLSKLAILTIAINLQNFCLLESDGSLINLSLLSEHRIYL